MQQKRLVLVLFTAFLLVLGLTMPAGADVTRVGMAYDGPPVDFSFNGLAQQGMLDAKDDYRFRARELAPVMPDGRTLTFNQEILQLSRRSNLVVGVGFLFADPIAVNAPRNPDVNYALIDSFVDQPNVASILFAANEGSFLVGAAAAMTSETDVIGFIGGVDIDLIHEFRAGFEAGVDYVNPDATVLVEFVSTPPDFSGFGDPDGAYVIAEGMYAAGADVIYHAAGGSGFGLFEAARDFSLANDHVWAIGVDSDQYLAFGDDLKPYILTSMLKRVDVATYDMIAAEVTGSFVGGFHWYNLGANGVDYSTSGGFIDDIVPDLEAIRASIIDGSIVVPSS